MNSQLSQRDLEQLSAYTDGSLAPRGQAQLEERIKAEPALARALKHLEATRSMLRRAPQRRVPRSFAVTHEMLSQRSSPVLRAGWNSYSLVSAAASLLLVLVILGDFSVNGLPALGAAAPAAEEVPEAFMLQEAPADGGEAGDTLPTEEDLAYADRQAEKSEFDGRAFFAQNVRPIEFGLALIALLSGLIALLNKRKV